MAMFACTGGTVLGSRVLGPHSRIKNRCGKSKHRQQTCKFPSREGVRGGFELMEA